MNWKHTPIDKVYEAMGAIADKRVEIDGDNAKVLSSSRNKVYTVIFNKEKNEITSNDNNSYYIGYMGYPIIAYLMKKKMIKYDEKLCNVFKGIHWKDINQKNSNDYEKTTKEVKIALEKKGFSFDKIEQEAENILRQSYALKLERMESEERPPEGY